MKHLLKRKIRRLAKKLVLYAIRLQLFFVLKLEKSDTVSGFHKIFSKLNNSKIINYLLLICEHRHQLSNEEYLLLEIVKRMNKMGYFYTPEPVFYGDASIIEKVKNCQSLVITTIHNGFAFTIKFVNSLNRKVATIAADSDYVKDKVFNRTGINSKVKVIFRDKFCLANLTGAVRDKHIICCDIDYQKSKREKFLYISPALFIFAKKSNLPVLFARYEISNTGKLEIKLKESNNQKEAEEITIDFIDFVNSSRASKRQLTLSKF
jgi:hypothetical protein